MKFLLLIGFYGLAIVPSPILGQNIQKKIVKADKMSFNCSLFEPKAKVSSILLLLPCLGEKPETIFEKTRLPALLAEHGFLTILPDLGKTLFADSTTCADLHKQMQYFIEMNKLGELPVVVGGFSRGGAISLRFAEHILSAGITVNLRGVFAIDPALDLQRLYYSSINKSRYGCSKLITKEGASITNYLVEKLGDSPQTQRVKYIGHSVYSHNIDSGGNAKYLLNIPVRLYSEPDLAFVKQKYCQQLQEDDLNAFDIRYFFSVCSEKFE
ncbi:alpha/beta fold hydrolase [Arundinibacter roseus]|uniref:Alpha/beta hydrolase n=1 Tax=Arundinibacter roseus TaxID=2070510 RepID=A0A4R4K5W7_9BACT|nr:alpha/beta hydrolase [Arundinibacter roseus]TDB62693.1 alpha/beta hydrolase [Arundinibacter roseus]